MPLCRQATSGKVRGRHRLPVAGYVVSRAPGFKASTRAQRGWRSHAPTCHVWATYLPQPPRRLTSRAISGLCCRSGGRCLGQMMAFTITFLLQRAQGRQGFTRASERVSCVISETLTPSFPPPFNAPTSMARGMGSPTKPPKPLSNNGEGRREKSECSWGQGSYPRPCAGRLLATQPQQ